MIHHARMTLKAWFPLCTAWHIQSHSCHLITTGHWLTQTQQGGGKRLPAGQGPWSSCLSHCQVSKTNSGQKHDTLGCESACEWQSLPLMEGRNANPLLWLPKLVGPDFAQVWEVKGEERQRSHKLQVFAFFQAATNTWISVFHLEGKHYTRNCNVQEVDIT